MTVRELLVKIGVDVDGEGAMDRVNDKLESIKQAAKGLATVLSGTAIAYGATGAAAGAAAANFAEYSEEVVRNAQSLGMATSKYQQFRFAFKNLNASVDDMMDAFSTVTDRAQDALTGGSKEYRRQFQRLGITMDQLRNKEPGAIFETYMANAQEVVSRTDSVTSAVRLFGDDLGRRIMPALTSATESFTQLMDRGTRMGVVMEDEVLEKGRRVRMQWRALRGGVNALYRQIGFELLPIFADFVNRLIRFVKWLQHSEAATNAAQEIMEVWAEDVNKLIELFHDLAGMTILEGMLDNADAIAVAFKFIVGIVSSGLVAYIGYVAYSLLPAVLGAVSSISWSAGGIYSALSLISTILASATAKIVALTALIFTVFLIVEDIYVYMIGGESLIGSIVEKFGEGHGWLANIVDMFEQMAPTLRAIWTVTKLVVGLVSVVVFEILEHTLYILGDILQFVLGAIAAVVGAVFELFNLIVDFYAGVAATLYLIAIGEWDRALATAKKTFYDYVQGFWDIVKDFVLDVTKLLYDLIGGFISENLSALGDLASWIPGIGSKIEKEIEKINRMIGQGPPLMTEAEKKRADQIVKNAQKAASLMGPGYGLLDPSGASGVGTATNSMVPEAMQRGGGGGGTTNNQNAKIEQYFYGPASPGDVKNASEEGTKKGLDEAKGGPR